MSTSVADDLLTPCLVHRPISLLEYPVRGKTGTGNQLPTAQLDPVPVLLGLDTRKHLSDDALVRWGSGQFSRILIGGLYYWSHISLPLGKIPRVGHCRCRRPIDDSLIDD